MRRHYEASAPTFPSADFSRVASFLRQYNRARHRGRELPAIGEPLNPSEQGRMARFLAIADPNGYAQSVDQPSVRHSSTPNPPRYLRDQQESLEQPLVTAAAAGMLSETVSIELPVAGLSSADVETNQ